ncbi:MAG: hypothetical protein HY852_03360 [Bradyrhizobium sp.]|uniref:hypothetical protein n=1 Tax=Bradyrhizobium sp. TaxID=376 RepID=UPI0025C535E2|nr:hypothetical protein [Bradyrhizobium sp.]MBI5260841.1 hypothetical protein [Bradyrhizobium sp.]
MFELGILCVILLAAFYWTTLWIMGRREDVLHGKFVHPDPASAEPKTVGRRLPEAPRLPPPPVLPPPLPPRADPKTLQALLDTIKRDLKDASQT